MAAHHGRPGGRGLELLLLFVLIAASAALLFGGMLVVLAAAFIVEAYIGGQSGKLGGAIAFGAYLGLLWSLGVIWKKFLRYYRYDPATLKPLKEGKSDDGEDH